MSHKSEQRILLQPPYMNGHEKRYVREAFDTNWIAPLGPNVDAFEKAVCEYTKIKYALALSSGTSAIQLALRYLGVGPGDYVFCSSLTFTGSCNPIMYQGATPVFIDSETDTWNMSADALREAFEWAKKENKMPKAVIIVDLYGQSADYDKLIPVCNEYEVPIVEDSAEALGCYYRGEQYKGMCGSFGTIGIFSFNGNKIITTSGGGMAVSNDKAATDRMRFWSTQAKEPTLYYEHKEYGYNYRMSNVCAGIGRGQLMTIEDIIDIKSEIFKTYRDCFKDLPITMMPISKKNRPNFWLHALTIDEDVTDVKPIDVINALEDANIESRPIWKPMHLQPVFEGTKFFTTRSTSSVGEDLFNRGLCLPSGAGMDDLDLNRVISTVKSVFENRS